MSTEDRYVYSIDGEEFRTQSATSTAGWETREEALAAGREQSALLARLKATPPAPVWTAIRVPCSAASFFPDADHIIDHMSQDASDEVGSDFADTWPDVGVVSSEAPEESDGRELHDFVTDTLHPFLQAWVKKHGLEPSFWTVSESVKHADDDQALATKAGE